MTRRRTIAALLVGIGGAASALAAPAVAAAPQDVHFTRVTATHPVVGEIFSVSTAQGNSGNPVVIGTTTPDVCSTRGIVVVVRHRGTCVLTADQPGNAAYDPGHASTEVTTYAGTSTTSLGFRPRVLVAQVAAVEPAVGEPDGRVGFHVDGRYVGSAPVSNGRAYLHYVVPTGARHTAFAVYRGSNDFIRSSGTAARRDPSISASISSAHPRTRYGWYRSPVRVTFRCTEATAPVSCPAAYTWRANTYRATLARTIVASDGGRHTVHVRGISLDHVRPQVAVRGGRAVCHDGYSGIASCFLTRTRAVAVDKAGNRASVAR